MTPARHQGEPDRFEPMRLNLNRALAFCGLQTGEIGGTARAQTLIEAHSTHARSRPILRSVVWWTTRVIAIIHVPVRAEAFVKKRSRAR